MRRPENVRASWEKIRNAASAGKDTPARVYHLRTEAGRHEVDFIIEGPRGALGLEVKLSGTVTDKDTTHLRWLREKLGESCVDVGVLHTGPEAYRRQDGIAVIPLGLLGP